MAELCSFLWKSIFSKASWGSQDVIENIPLESKQMTDYCFESQSSEPGGIFFGKWQLFEIFLKILTPFLISFL